MKTVEPAHIAAHIVTIRLLALRLGIVRTIPFIFALAVCLTLGGCSANSTFRGLEKFEFTRLGMGVKARIVLYAPTHQQAANAASDAFGEINRLDAIMSDYRPDSELMRLCDQAGGPAVHVSHDLFEVLTVAQQISHASGGAFDVTIGPAVRWWREARRSGEPPSPDAVAAARNLIGWEMMTLDPAAQAVQLQRPGMRLDLGGIGKGYAAQRAAELLHARGLARCLVALAGDIVVGDPPPDANGWRIALPGNDLRFLARTAVSTSGASVQFIEIGGVRRSHILDPRMGLELTDTWTVTVIAPRGELADALASAACVLGPQHSRRVLAKFPEASVIWN